jgi:hypothetical protein
MSPKAAIENQIISAPVAPDDAPVLLSQSGAEVAEQVKKQEETKRKRLEICIRGFSGVQGSLPQGQ